MGSKLSKFKPGVKRQTHLFLSAFLWTVIGSLLLTKGAVRLTQFEDYQFLVVVSAFTVGSLKALLVLDKVAGKTIKRILGFSDGICLGAVYSVKTWVVVAMMVSVGVILRNSSLPVMLLTFIYLTIGWSLLLSSRLGWKAYLAIR